MAHPLTAPTLTLPLPLTRHRDIPQFYARVQLPSLSVAIIDSVKVRWPRVLSLCPLLLRFTVIIYLFIYTSFIDSLILSFLPLLTLLSSLNVVFTSCIPRYISHSLTPIIHSIKYSIIILFTSEQILMHILLLFHRSWT